MQLLHTPSKPLWPFTLNKSSDQANGLIGWWPGGPSGGLKLFDQSGAGNHGTLTSFAAPFTNTSGWAQGKDGGSGLKFDGTDDYAIVSSAPQLNNQTFVSVGVWCKIPTGLATFLRLIEKGATTEWTLNINQVNTNSFCFLSNIGGTVTASSATNSITDKWQFVMGVLSASATMLYLDGVQVASTASTRSASLTGALNFGRYGGGAYCINGLMSDAVIFNRALSAAEVFALYHPSTRWQLRYKPGVKRWFFGGIAGIAFAAASNSGYQAAASTYSWSHTCTGNNRFLSVDVSILSVPGTTVTGITYNGVAMLLIGAKSTVTAFGRVECWGLANPASGSNTIAVTLSAAISSASTAVSYTGVELLNPTEAFNSAQATNVGAADATVNVTTATNNAWVHGALVTNDGSVTANQTTRNNVTGALGSGADEDTGPKTPAGAVTISYTDVGAAATWAIAGYGIRPTAAFLAKRFRTIPSEAVKHSLTW